jgi:hypothetical protein
MLIVIMDISLIIIVYSLLLFCDNTTFQKIKYISKQRIQNIIYVVTKLMIYNINVITLKLLTIILHDVLNVKKVIIKNVRMKTCK